MSRKNGMTRNFLEDQQREYEKQYIAGQVKNRDDSTTAPKAEIKPLNITGFFDAQTAKEASESTNEKDIYFSADEMINDNKEQTITALGNVNIIRNDITIVADKVTYNQVTDVVTASGNVIIVEESGNVAFSDYVELTDKMSKGFMDNVKVTMADETKVTAKKFRRLANNNKEMEDATYTPCDACENSSPLWQLSAFDVTHDAESQNVLKDCLEIQKAMAHKPFNPDSDAYQKFILQTLLKIDRLNEKMTFFDYSKERNILKTKLK